MRPPGRNAIDDELAPGLTQRCGIGSVSAAQAIVSFSQAGRFVRARIADGSYLTAYRPRLGLADLMLCGEVSDCEQRGALAR